MAVETLAEGFDLIAARADIIALGQQRSVSWDDKKPNVVIDRLKGLFLLANQRWHRVRNLQPTPDDQLAKLRQQEIQNEYFLWLASISGIVDLNIELRGAATRSLVLVLSNKIDHLGDLEHIVETDSRQQRDSGLTEERFFLKGAIAQINMLPQMHFSASNIRAINSFIAPHSTPEDIAAARKFAFQNIIKRDQPPHK